MSRSIDGMSIGTPTAVALDGRDAMLAVAMNGETLPAVHGYPVRLIVPGLYGYVSATKWLVELELTTFDAFDPYWVRARLGEGRPDQDDGPDRHPRSRSARSPPARSPSPASPGRSTAASSASRSASTAGHGRPPGRRAIDTIDTWRQWVLEWDATSGNHTIEARATDAAGEIQTEHRAEPFPDGATGWHSVVMTVT